ncbi:sigma-54-dependent Fis family transcriptional regulator [Myxococcota bacterium]|nr:sigma-54-dependent Fis family transcriptional regulator [Myxococcota bacterium]
MDKSTENQHLKTKVELVKKIVEAKSQREVLQIMLEGAVFLTESSQGFVILLDNGRHKIKATHNWPKSQLRGHSFKSYIRVTDHVLRTSESILSADASIDSRISLKADNDIKSILVVPIVFNSNKIGAICLTKSHNGKNPIEVHDLQSIKDLSKIVAAILNYINEINRLLSDQEHLKKAALELEELTASLQEDVVAKSVEIAHFERTLLSTSAALKIKYSFPNIITRSPKMYIVFDLISRVCDYQVPVLVFGESGTGKELIAKSLHYKSIRKELPFMAINCAAMPETLLESELFGYKRGAFTGANTDKEGLLRLAGEGTVFLDEIGELPLGLQAKLLRVIQEREVLPIGGQRVEPFKARLISATHRDLRAQIKRGLFREDLFFRLKVVQISLPPLRERPEDIPPLIEHLQARFHEDLRIPQRALSPHALRCLMRHPWPGNVRELENALKSALILSKGATLEPADFALEAPPPAPPPPPPPQDSAPDSAPDSATPTRLAPMLKRPSPARLSLPLAVPQGGVQSRADWEAIERAEIIAALVHCRWNKTKAAAMLGISRRNLYRKLLTYEIEPARRGQ